MTTLDTMDFRGEFIEPEGEQPIIKVIGVGGGGGNAIQHMYEQGISNVSFVICNTDRQALINSSVPNKLMLGHTGLGAGNKPEIARTAAEETIEQIGELFTDNTKMVFITAGMGGGTGTGAAPVVARVAREHGMLTIGIVTIPFLFEGRKKILKALEGADEMSKYVDALLVINNERLTEIYPDLNFMNGFGKADDTLTTAARGISELITNDNHVINIDFNDVDTTLRNGGAAVISIGYGEGENRVTKALNDALNSPLLKDSDISNSRRILFNIYFNPSAEQEFVMKEANELSEFINRIDPNVDVIWGLAKDPSLGNKVKVTLLAAGFKNEKKSEVDGAEELYTKPGKGQKESKPEVIDVKVNEPAQSKDEDAKIRELYGEGADTVMKGPETQKQIVLTPDQLNDDAAIEIFEKNPTFTRQRQVVEEVRNMAKKSDADKRSDDVATPDKDTPSTGTHISFI